MQRSQDHEDETPDAFNSARVVSIRVGTFMNCVSFMSLAYTVNKHELNGKPTYRKTLELGNSFCSLKELSGSCISSNTRFEVVTIVSTRVFTLITNNRGPLEHGALKIWFILFYWFVDKDHLEKIKTLTWTAESINLGNLTTTTVCVCVVKISMKVLSQLENAIEQ